MTVEAHAFSQGTDITSSVGPFTWSASNASVVNLIPLVNTAYNFPTNQATAIGAVPGITQIFATASGVTSHSFQQPQYSNRKEPILRFLISFRLAPFKASASKLARPALGRPASSPPREFPKTSSPPSPMHGK